MTRSIREIVELHLNYAADLIHVNILRFRSMSARSPEGRGGYRFAWAGDSSPNDQGGPARPMPSVRNTPLQFNPEYCVVALRHDALGTRGRWVVFASLAGASLASGLGLAAAGAWLVLPCSLIEGCFGRARVCVHREAVWELGATQRGRELRRRRAGRRGNGEPARVQSLAGAGRSGRCGHPGSPQAGTALRWRAVRVWQGPARSRKAGGGEGVAVARKAALNTQRRERAST